MANCSGVFVIVEQHVTVSDPFVLMRNCTSGIHSIDPAAIDVAKLSSACFSSIRLRTRVSFHRPTSRRLAPIPRMPATAQARSRTKRWAIYRRQNRPCAELRHPRNVPATTHKINMTSESLEEMEALTVRGWRVGRGFLRTRARLHTDEEKIGKERGQGGGVSVEQIPPRGGQPARPQLARMRVAPLLLS